MPFTSKPIAVYGAAGHTGRFVVQEARRRGLQVVAVGRSAARLDLAFPPPLPRRIAGLDDPAGLERSFQGCAVVINCAGPFLDTATQVARAALAAGCHYLDVTAEQASAQATLADLDAPARAAGKAVVPAGGFYGGLADLLASALATPGTMDEIDVAIALDRWWPTAGTRRTGARNTVPRVVVKGGRLVPLTPSPEVPDWTFSPPLGRQPMIEVPFSEMITLAHHLETGSIRSLLNRSALQDVRDPATPPPAAVDDRGRSAQRFELVVKVAQHGEIRMAGARGQDIYAVTAPIVVEAVQRLLEDGYPHRGAMTLAQATDPVDMLRALNGQGLEVFGEIAPRVASRN